MNAIYIRELHALLRKAGAGVLLVASLFLAGCPPPVVKIPNPPPQPQPSRATAVTTHHYDNQRLGWNSNETQLNSSNVSSLSRLVIKLDDPNDQVDTQPLIVPNLSIAGEQHDVVYVSTENNSLYAFDANTGTRLNMVNLGSPVPMPQGCNTNGPAVGINGTPVIDLPSSTMYVITYNLESGHPVYIIHALDLVTL